MAKRSLLVGLVEHLGDAYPFVLDDDNRGAQSAMICNTRTMDIRRAAALIAIPLLAVSLAACSSSDPVTAPVAATAPGTVAPTVEQVVTPTPEPEPVSSCINVAQSTVDALNTSINAIQAGNSITAAYAIKAGERENVYFIAADVTGDGMKPGDAPGLWATNDDVTVDPHSGMMFSVNSYANMFSDMADGAKISAPFSSREDGAKDALDCIPQ